MNQRQTNKANRQRLIVKNAARLFSSTGYNQTTIEMVAERSNVSPVTIYNNFENKTGLLLAVLIEEGAGAKGLGERIIDQREHGDAEVLYRLIEVYVDHPMEFMNKSCWRQSLAAATASESKKFTEEYQNVDKTLCKQLITVVCSLYEEGVFKAQVDAHTLGEVLWNNINQMFTDYISDDGMTLGALKSALRRQTEALLLLAMRP
ncbi:MAG: TetR/AcrR family transcriptional regulator [Pseudomonadales bacterium]